MWINSNISTAAFSRRWTIFNPYLLMNKLRFSWNDLLWIKEHWLMSKLRFDSQSLESLGSVPPRRPIPAVVLHSSENLEESSGDCWDHETGGDWWGNYVEIKYKRRNTALSVAQGVQNLTLFEHQDSQSQSVFLGYTDPSVLATSLCKAGRAAAKRLQGCCMPMSLTFSTFPFSTSGSHK